MFKSLQIHYKLFISFSIFIFVILAISSGLFYFYTQSVVENNIVEKQQQTVQKIQEQMDHLLSQIDNMTISVNSSDLIMNILEDIPDGKEENYFDKYPRISEEIRSFLFSLTALKSMNGRISIISKHDDFLDFSNRNDTQYVTKENVRNLKIVKEGMVTEQFKMFLPPHQDEWSINGGKVFSVVRPLRNTNYEIQGLIEVSYYINPIDRLFEFKENSQVLKGVILDQNLSVIYNNFQFKTDNNWIYNNKLVNGQYGNYQVKNPEDGKDYIITFNKLANTDWTILLLEDMTIFEKPIYFLRNMTIISYLSIFTVFLIVLYIYTKNITMPIRRLKMSVLSVDRQSLRLRLKPAQRNEITLLAQAFQDLLNEVNDSMKLMVESRSREMNAHMMALQAQMNPHFLYNTLAVIGAYGIKKGNDEVMQMCADLSDMLRYTIEYDDGDTKIRSEVVHIQKYLALMALRFEGYLQYDIDLDTALMDIPIPKLTLEPLVENVFRHGFTDVAPPWKVSVKGLIKDQRWQIRIEDNGKGFQSEVITQLKNKMDMDKNIISPENFFGNQEKDGIGLINTFMRLHLLYKGQETIELFNSDQGGAIIIIGGPISH